MSNVQCSIDEQERFCQRLIPQDINEYISVMKA
jgi:hypothetical protein